MPFDFKLVRKIELDNPTSLGANKNLAGNMLGTFKELYDPNEATSEYYYLNREINPQSDYPEFHFELYADYVSFSFIVHFWQNSIYFEFGAGHDPEVLFCQLQALAQVIIQNGFLVDDPREEKLWDLPSGIDRHKIEYKTWSGFVDQIIEKLNNEE